MITVVLAATGVIPDSRAQVADSFLLIWGTSHTWNTWNCSHNSTSNQFLPFPKGSLEIVPGEGRTQGLYALQATAEETWSASVLQCDKVGSCLQSLEQPACTESWWKILLVRTATLPWTEPWRTRRYKQTIYITPERLRHRSQWIDAICTNTMHL